MATHMYHWKHGWIPLDHYAAMSKAKGSESGARRYLAGSHAAGHAHGSVVGGSYAGGTHERGLQPVAAEHLPRRSSIVAAFNPATRQFALHDRTGHSQGRQQETTAAIPEKLAEHFHAEHYRIWRVRREDNGQHRVVVTTPSGETKSFAADGSDIKQVDPVAPPPTERQTRAPQPVGGSPLLPTWTQISTEEALGPDTRDEKQKAWDQYITSAKQGRRTTRNTGARERAIAKVQQAYRHREGHVVMIEPTMSKVKTAQFLASVDHVVSNAGASNLVEPVRFHVPTGDRQFSSGRTLAYVRQGEHGVYVSPKVAGGYEADKAAHSAHFMPAHQTTSTLRYTLAHELGHVIDHKHEHIRSQNAMPAYPYGGASKADQSTAKSLFQEYRGELSKYGATSATEAYAEAYAQWHSGQRNGVADAYAARYGWKR